MKNQINFQKWLIILTIISGLTRVRSQLEDMSNVGNIGEFLSVFIHNVNLKALNHLIINTER